MYTKEYAMPEIVNRNKKKTKTTAGKAESRDGTAAFFFSCFGLHEISPFMHFRCVHVY